MSLDPSRALSNKGSLNVAAAATTMPMSLTTSSVLKWTLRFAVTWSCDGKLSTAGSTQCAAVSTQLGAISVPVHRLLPTTTPTTLGYWPGVVAVPPMMSTGGDPVVPRISIAEPGEPGASGAADAGAAT